MSSTPPDTEASRAKAEVKAARDLEAREAMDDYKAAAKAIDERTARLKALRLEQEAKEAAASAEAAAEAKPKKKRAARAK